MRTFHIHSAVADDVEVVATVNGLPVNARVAGVVIEAVSDDGAESHTFRFVQNAEDYLARFPVGAMCAVELISVSNAALTQEPAAANTETTEE